MSALALPRRRRSLTGLGWFLVVAVVAEPAYLGLTTTNFAGDGSSMLMLAEQFAPTGPIAVGLAMVVLPGNIDLSVGATASLGAIVTGLLLTHHHPICWALLLGEAPQILCRSYSGRGSEPDPVFRTPHL